MSQNVVRSFNALPSFCRGARTSICTQRLSVKHQVLVPARPFSHTPAWLYPRKDSQDKDSINTEATEYSKSATDDESARQEDAAFNPDITDPQEQKNVAGKNSESSTNPLEVSPANPEVSKPRGDTEGGAENSSASSGTTSDRERSSGGGSPSKGKKVA